jgi:hypothetical protein
MAWGTNLPEKVIWRQRVNELRFVRATLAWENFLENTMLCYLCGARSAVGNNYPINGAVSATLSAAQRVALGGAPYGRWLNPNWVIGRTGALFAAHNPYHILAGPVFDEVRVIRNRIVHRSDAVRVQFRQLVTQLHGVVRPTMTPGRLLTERVAGTERVEGYLQTLRIAGGALIA